MGVSLTSAARQVAEQALAVALPSRWIHVQAVAAAAKRLERVVPDSDVLVAAAWLHDIGYAPDIADSGLHALDGARWLVRHGWDEPVTELVANHSCALYEAQERGLAEALATEFPRRRTPTADALWYADMTTGPLGQTMTVRERLQEIRKRYGPDDVVTRFWRRAEPELLEAVQRTERRLARQPM